MLIRLRQNIEQKKGQRDKVKSFLSSCRIQIKSLKEELENSRYAQIIIQRVSQETQKQLEWHISEIVSLALRSVFDDPYTFKIEFVLKRGKTECNLYFERNGHKIENPINEIGGGVIDIASFALRVSMWSLAKPRWRNTLIFDEPFKNINDKTRKTHRRIAELIKMLSEKMNLQFIIITMIEEIEEVADKVFEFSLVNGKTKIKEYNKEDN